MTPRLTVVVDQPHAVPLSRALVTRALGHLAKSITMPEWTVIPASDVSGVKKPGIAAIRAYREEFWQRLADTRPTAILAMGPVALTQVTGSRDLMKITESRGIMRMTSIAPFVPTGSAGGIMAWPDMYRDLVRDLWKVLTQERPRPTLRPRDGSVLWHVCESPAEAMVRLQDFRGEDALSCDIETTGFDPWSNTITQVGFGRYLGPGRSEVVIVKGPALEDYAVGDEMWDLVFSTKHTTVMHNAKFDLKFLLRFFESVTPYGARIADTMLLHHLLDERPVGKMAGSVHSLKTLARVYYDQEDYAFDHEGHNKRVADGTITREEIDEFDWYHARDCHFTIQLWNDLREEAEDNALLAHHDELIGPVSLVFAHAELIGAPVDRDRLIGFGTQLRGEVDALGKRLTLGWKGNPASPTDIWAHLVDDLDIPPTVMTGGTRRGIDKETTTDRAALTRTLKWLEAKGRTEDASWVRDLLAYRTATKSLGTYVDPLLARTVARPRINASFWLAGTVTGRLSSSDPNLQNIPARHGENIRDVFAANPGSVWAEVDYSQLELRVAAMLSGDPWFGDLFREGHDVHTEVACAIFKKPAEAITKAERFIAKSVDFGILYGRSAWAIANDETIREILAADGKTIDQDEAQRFIDEFLNQYPRLRDWLQGQASFAFKHGYVNVGRRRRRFLFQNHDKTDPAAKKHIGEIRRQAMNSPIQGVASDITLDAMLRIAPRLSAGAELLFPVHDSICFHLSKSTLDEDLAVIREEMTRAPSWLDTKGVPLEVEAKVGETWGTTK